MQKGSKIKTSTNPQKLCDQDNIEVSVEDPSADTKPKPAIKLVEDGTILDEFIDNDNEKQILFNIGK